MAIFMTFGCVLCQCFEEYFKPSVSVTNIYTSHYWKVSVFKYTDNYFNLRIEFTPKIVEVECHSLRGKTVIQVILNNLMKGENILFDVCVRVSEDTKV